MIGLPLCYITKAPVQQSNVSSSEQPFSLFSYVLLKSISPPPGTVLRNYFLNIFKPCAIVARSPPPPPPPPKRNKVYFLSLADKTIKIYLQYIVVKGLHRLTCGPT